MYSRKFLKKLLSISDALATIYDDDKETTSPGFRTCISMAVDEVEKAINMQLIAGGDEAKEMEKLEKASPRLPGLEIERGVDKLRPDGKEVEGITFSMGDAEKAITLLSKQKGV